MAMQRQRRNVCVAVAWVCIEWMDVEKEEEWNCYRKLNGGAAAAAIDCSERRALIKLITEQVINMIDYCAVYNHFA